MGVYDYVLNSMLHQADLFRSCRRCFYVCKRQTSWEVGPENTKTDEQYIF
jgi:hypothetical protein